MLPPPEKSPVVLLQWSKKALSTKGGSVIPLVKEAMEGGGLILLPSLAGDTLLISASQWALEAQAELDGLVKERVVGGEMIMDHFTVAARDSFRRDGAGDWDRYGLFTLGERGHLVEGILGRIGADHFLVGLLSGDGSGGSARSDNLRHLLRRHGWIEVVTALHDDGQRAGVQQATWWPLRQVAPPVDRIRDYYGAKVAMYFAFMGLLNRWLGALGVLGTGVAAFRIYRGDTVDEDEYTPFYGLACFVWSILFLRFWEREANALAYRWGTLPITDVADDFGQIYSLDYGGNHSLHRRPEFRGHVRTSPVTGEPELYYPGYKRKIHYLVSAVVTGLMLGVAFLVMILSLNLQGYIVPRKSYHPFHFPAFAILSTEGALFDAESDWCCFIPVVLHAVCILTLNTIYKLVARKLTDWENHVTQADYENSMILKRFLFEAFDCYVALFYLAFFERDVDRLRTELIAVFYIDMLRRVATEVLLPIVLNYRTEKDAEHPHDLHLDEYDSFDDYMEILITFGYVTLFASAYPFASMVMFVSVWVEVRSDIYKLTYLCQKPAVDCASGIGMWKTVLSFMVWFSCLTNCLLFGFTSDQMMHFLPDLYLRDSDGVTHLVRDKGWLAVLLIFGLERALLYLGLALHAMISVMPEALEVKLKRRKFLLAKESEKKKTE